MVILANDCLSDGVDGGTADLLRVEVRASLEVDGELGVDCDDPLIIPPKVLVSIPTEHQVSKQQHNDRHHTEVYLDKSSNHPSLKLCTCTCLDQQ